MESFFIRSRAGVPWTFQDRGNVLVGKAPGMIGQIKPLKTCHSAVLTDGRWRVLSDAKRHGLAAAVAFLLESGDRYTADFATAVARIEGPIDASPTGQELTNLPANSTDGPSSTVSFSQVRENSGVKA